MSEQTTAKETKKSVRKRPKKEETVSILLNMNSFVQNQIANFTPEVFKAQCELKNLFLYENEVAEVCEKQKAKEPSFDADFFTNLLLSANAIEEGERPYFGGVAGGGLVRINTRTRAEEIVNDPADTDKVMELVSKILEIGKELDPLISNKAELSIALKNKGEYVKKRKVVETTEEVS